MKHDLEVHFDADGPYYTCRQCGQIISPNSRLSWLIKDECPAVSAPPPLVSRDEAQKKGDALIKRWESGE